MQLTLILSTNYTPRVNLRAPALIALAGLSTLALAACSGPAAGTDASAAPTAEGEAFAVVATTTQVADFTRELTGGLNVEVTQLLQPGTSAHGFEPTPADLVALGSADLVVSSGAGLEEWLDAAVSSSGYAGEVVDASANVTLSGSHEHDHGEEAHTEEEHTHAEGEEQSHEEEAHEEEVHGEGNPHTWTSPANAKLMAVEIATHLEELPGIDAAAVQANADAYDAELTELDDSWWTDEVRFAAVVTEVRPPAAGISAAVLTYSDVRVFYATYSAAKARYATYSDVKRDTSLIGAADA